MALACMTFPSSIRQVQCVHEKSTQVVIEYWMGWHWQPKYCSAVPVKCYIEIPQSSIRDFQDNQLEYIVVDLYRPMNFSWGSGPTKEIEQIVLMERGECGYITESGQVEQWYGTRRPIWSIINQ